jgi:hypothetical protein
MKDVYETEIQPLLSTLSPNLNDLICSLSEQFIELRKASNKMHFLDGEDSDGREKLTAEMRRRAVLTAVYAMGIVNQIDANKEMEKSK